MAGNSYDSILQEKVTLNQNEVLNHLNKCPSLRWTSGSLGGRKMIKKEFSFSSTPCEMKAVVIEAVIDSDLIFDIMNFWQWDKK